MQKVADLISADIDIRQNTNDIIVYKYIITLLKNRRERKSNYIKV